MNENALYLSSMEEAERQSERIGEPDSSNSTEPPRSDDTSVRDEALPDSAALLRKPPPDDKTVEQEIIPDNAALTREPPADDTSVQRKSPPDETTTLLYKPSTDDTSVRRKPPPDYTTLQLKLRTRIPQKIEQPTTRLRHRLWRDFDVDPEWTGGEPTTGELPKALLDTPSVPMPVLLPGAKRSVLPHGLADRTRWQSVLAVPYQGRRKIKTFAPILGRADRLVDAFFVLCWLAALVLFWTWWFRPTHLVTLVGLVLNTALLLYLCYLPVYFVLTSLRLRRVNPRLPVRDFRVAFVVTKVPSEPWHMVRTTLIGMISQDYPHPHDIWVCDEDPDEETYAWCADHGVGISTRFGFPEYHRADWPRRTKCKEGNLSFFYDYWGYDYYDVVAQLDADHVPEPGYLAEMVRPFADPKIGYVAAPSICDANAADSWAARGRLYREANLHGPVQVGSNGWLAPVCFGSHYAVRTAALRDIGGIGPELAEDFSTTFLMCAAGWDGAFAIDAEAHGDGPATFAAALTQEFQWSRSLMLLFIDLFPLYVRRLPLLLRIRFLFSLSYYPMLAVTTALGLLLAPVACFTGVPWVAVNYLQFGLLWGLVSAAMLILNAHLRRMKLFRPVRSKLFGWEMWLFTLSRWPYVGWGVIAGILQKIRPVPVTFKVTPKGDCGVEKLPLRVLAPYLTVSMISFAGAAYGSAMHHPAGYILLAMIGGMAYLATLLLVAVMHVVETRRAAGTSLVESMSTIVAPLVAVLLLAGLGAAAGGLSWFTYHDLVIGFLERMGDLR